jgi:NTE family protein
MPTPNRRTPLQIQPPSKPPTAQQPVVLVLQGGGALGAYQWGVYEALHERGIEPDWVIGTSIGAINAALIAGNAAEHRLDRLQRFWSRIEQRVPGGHAMDWFGLGSLMSNMAIVSRGVPGFFTPNAAAMRGMQAQVGAEQASYYDTQPLRETLAELVGL